MSYEKTTVNKLGRLANRGPLHRFYTLLYFFHRASYSIILISSPEPHISYFALSQPLLSFPIPCHLPTRTGTYDFSTVHTIINTCPVLHVSFVDPAHPFPVVLPMLGCTADYQNQTADPETSEQDMYVTRGNKSICLSFKIEHGTLLRVSLYCLKQG